MSSALAASLVLIAAFIAAVVLVLGMASVRSRAKIAERLAGRETAEMTALRDENEALRARLGRQEDRIAVLERIATDPAERTAREIEHLR